MVANYPNKNYFIKNYLYIQEAQKKKKNSKKDKHKEIYKQIPYRKNADSQIQRENLESSK